MRRILSFGGLLLPRPRRSRASRPQTASASSAVGASTITRTSGSVPLGRTSTRPRPLSAADSASTSPAIASTAPVERRAVGEADVDEPLRELLHRVPAGQVAAPSASSVSSAAAIPSPDGTKPVSMMWPDCSPPSAQPRSRSASST